MSRNLCQQLSCCENLKTFIETYIDRYVRDLGLIGGKEQVTERMGWRNVVVASTVGPGVYRQILG